MRRTGTTAAIVASPVLVGAVTALVIVVAVFLAYNANQGLPFVPTYDINVEVPSGANLVAGNDVRIGGTRVGAVSSITPTTVEQNGRTRAIAVLGLKLDKSASPLPVDTAAIVRTRSALGLKYVELDVGSATATYDPGDTIPVDHAGRIVEFDDFLNTFDQKNRDDQRQLLAGFGDALAGRGQSLNEAIGALPEFFGSLTNVMDALNDPSTQLDQFFTQIGAVAQELAPVAAAQAELFTRMADTFAAIDNDPAALRATISETPATLTQATTSFVHQRPFLDDFAELSAKLQPAVRILPHALPDVNDALEEGEDTLPRTVSMSQKLEGTLKALDELGRDPNTLGGTKDLRYAFASLAPAITYTAPVNTVCNFTNYFFTGLGEHISQQVDGGTSERIELNFDNFMQENRLGSTENSRPASIPLDQETPYSRAFPLGPATRPNAIILSAANKASLTADDKANCNTGQFGYAKGPISDGIRYKNDEEGGHLGIVNDSFPVKVPTTWTGVPSLKKVDSGDKYSLRKAP
jgi:virulence factor Mce-like protein